MAPPRSSRSPRRPRRQRDRAAAVPGGGETFTPRGCFRRQRHAVCPRVRHCSTTSSSTFPRRTPEFSREPSSARRLQFLVRLTDGGQCAGATCSWARRCPWRRGLDGSTRAPGAVGGEGRAMGPGATGTEVRWRGASTSLERSTPTGSRDRAGWRCRSDAPPSAQADRLRGSGRGPREVEWIWQDSSRAALGRASEASRSREARSRWR